jgi:Protein of unknown function (DUF3604)
MRSSFVFVLTIPLSGLAAACGGTGTTGVSPGDAGAADHATSDGAHSDGTAGDASEGGADAGMMCTGEGGGLAYSKYKWALFGNMHQHTANSLDAYSFGTRATPADAYQFAKGAASITIGATTTDPAGPTVKIDRPLDFLALTDHSEWLGVVKACQDATSTVYDSTDCKAVRSDNATAQTYVFANLPGIYKNLCGDSSNTAQCVAEQRTAWQEEQTAAANAYDPCHFTSLVAYEWTSMIGLDTNHRNVFFGSAQVPNNPLDSYSYTTTSALFAGLDGQCMGECSALVIPHNSNMSQGVSLVPPSSASEVAEMQKYQRLAEIYQHKGSSECYYDPTSSSGDPDCAFEYVNPGATGDTPTSYVRTALESGMQYALANGTANPYEVGIISSTDDHNATAGFCEESTYSGHAGRLDDTPELRLTKSPDYGSGGLAVVWAEQNTRDAVFAALERRETYGTSGPRLMVRFYETSSSSPCTADFPNTILDANQALPMGSTFHSSDVTGAPLFAIAAWPDTFAQPLADGSTGVAGIATVQIIKAHGKAGGASPVITEDPPVALPMAAAGACVTWSDKSFDATEQAFYYVRVLQVPTWRWSHFACAAAPSTAGCEAGGTLDVTIQERAWTSPIWYVP